MVLVIESVRGGDASRVRQEIGRVAGERMVVHTVDVGQGDATVIVLPTDQVVLIDAGPLSGTDKLLAYLDANVYVAGKKIDKIDYAILSHPDLDHCGGFVGVLQRYVVKNFFRPNIVSKYPGWVDPLETQNAQGAGTDASSTDTLVYREVLKAVYERSEQVFVNAGMKDGLPTQIVGVSEDYRNQWSMELFWFGTKTLVGTVDNDYCPIVVLACRQRKFVLMGDVDGVVERLFLEYARKAGVMGLDADWVMMAHHGSASNGSNSQEFLDFVFGEGVGRVGSAYDCRFVNRDQRKTFDIANKPRCNGLTIGRCGHRCEGGVCMQQVGVMRGGEEMSKIEQGRGIWKVSQGVASERGLKECGDVSKTSASNERAVVGCVERVLHRSKQGEQKMAVVSVGKNGYGLPNTKVFDRLVQIGIQEASVYRTDKLGNVLVGVQESGEMVVAHGGMAKVHEFDPLVRVLQYTVLVGLMAMLCVDVSAIKPRKMPG